MCIRDRCIVVIWQIYHPEDDLVRRDRRGRPLDDPAGGPLDGAIGAYPPRDAARLDGVAGNVATGSVMAGDVTAGKSGGTERRFSTS